MEAASIWELAANSGISWISRASHLHLAMQLLTCSTKLVYTVLLGTCYKGVCFFGAPLWEAQ